MIETLISSKTRIKLLLKFFLNSQTTSYLRSLESEFGESSNAIRVELNRLENAGMLCSKMQGNKKIFQANTGHPLFAEIHNILLKHIGLDHVIENVIKRLGKVDKVFLIGDFSRGMNSQIIDLVFIGAIEKAFLIRLIEKVEALIHRKVRYLIYSSEEFVDIDWSKLETQPFLLWARD
ncbi:MAG: transcriptional regulator [Saprospiraceae bacterium]|nr:MAG: transcriptional regulator [Saprospiraceae bacterium]